MMAIELVKNGKSHLDTAKNKSDRWGDARKRILIGKISRAVDEPELMMAIELVKNGKSHLDTAKTNQIVGAMREKGILIGKISR